MNDTNIVFTLYNLVSGVMDAIINCQQEDADLNTPIGFGRVDGAWSGEKYYVLDGVVTAKTPMSPVVSGSTISNLPIPCVATIEGVRYMIDDGVLELDPSLPGPYVVTLEAVPYLPYKVTIP